MGTLGDLSITVRVHSTKAEAALRRTAKAEKAVAVAGREAARAATDADKAWRLRVKHAAKLTQTLRKLNRAEKDAADNDLAQASRQKALASQAEARAVAKVNRMMKRYNDRAAAKALAQSKRLVVARGRIARANFKAAMSERKLAMATRNYAQEARGVASVLRILPGRLGSAASGAASLGAAFTGLVVGGAAVVGALMLIGKGTVSVIKEFATFQNELFQAASVMGDISKDKVETLGESIKKMAGQTRFTITEVAGASKEWLRAGRSIDDFAAGGNKAVTTLAALGDVMPAEATKIVTKLMSQFNLEVSQTSDAMDIMAAVASNTPTDIKSLGNAMKFVGGTMDSAGVSFGEATALLGGLTKRLEAGQAARGLRTAIRNILKPSDDARAALKRLHLSAAVLQSQLNQPIKMARTLADAGASLQDMTDIFSARGAEVVTAMVAMEREGGQLSEVMNIVKNKSQGLADAMVALQDQSLVNQFKIWVSQLRNVAEQIGSMTDGAVRGLLAALRDLVGSIGDNKDALGEMASNVVRVATGLVRMVQMLVMAVGAMQDFAKENQLVLKVMRVLTLQASLAATGTGLFIDGLRGGAAAADIEARAVSGLAKKFDDLEAAQKGVSQGAGRLGTTGLFGNKNTRVAQHLAAAEKIAAAMAKSASESDKWAKALARARASLKAMATASADRRSVSDAGLTKGVASATNKALSEIQKVLDKQKGFGKHLSASADAAITGKISDMLVKLREVFKKAPELGEQAAAAALEVWNKVGERLTAAGKGDLDEVMNLGAEATARKQIADALAMGEKAVKAYTKAEQERIKVQDKILKDEIKHDKDLQKAQDQRMALELKLAKDAAALAAARTKAFFDGLQSVIDSVKAALDSLTSGNLGGAMSAMMAPLMSLLGPLGTALGAVLGFFTGLFDAAVNSGLQPERVQARIRAREAAELPGLTGDARETQQQAIRDQEGVLSIAPMLKAAGDAIIQFALPLVNNFRFLAAALAPLIHAVSAVVHALGAVSAVTFILQGFLFGLAGGLLVISNGLEILNGAIQNVIIGFNDMFNLDSSEARAELAASERRQAENNETMAAMLDGSFDSLMRERAARDDVTAGLNEMNEELTNIPSGFRRLRQRQFEAQAPQASADQLTALIGQQRRRRQLNGAPNPRLGGLFA